METEAIRKIYLVGIGGIAMGTLATMLKQSGFEVGGSDQNLYPPMSTHLRSLGIPLFEGFSPQNPQKFAPDLFIMGNVIRRENPEAQFIMAQARPCLSMPQAVSRFFLNGRKSIVVAGTHGKSTTSSVLAWALEQGGKDPGAFIGAFLKDWDRSYRLGSGEYMVLEGDEYDTAFFDKGPKFLHYQPYIGIVTSIEFDHADIFANLDAVLKAFRDFVRLIPERGCLVLNADDPNCGSLVSQCKGRVITYGRSPRADWRIESVDFRSGEVFFRLRNPGTSREQTFHSRLPGMYNVWNLTAAVAACDIAGLDIGSIRKAAWAFSGVKRRQDVVGEFAGVLVV
ncbi:MAG TPA: Mur ligase family protein, partial [Syntrophobacteraceae bacterium]|nr:Mur ligase family protein [Syntrophobacteraceae bacterium]